ncbi:MAG TPA: tetratricopeptide repeat protein [Pyrinomonadaceae bacterium]|nr:tetratricopeptide repeat protein [Pyrinomonadaceae bacterium]
MNRENVLFGVVGLLAGYLLAFHLVVHINQSQPAPRPAGGPAQGGDGRSLPSNEVKDRQRLQSEAEQAVAAARGNRASFEAQKAAAEALLEAENWAAALEFLTRANELRPDDYGTLVKLGHANSETENYEAAEKWFKAALAKKPEDNDARSELALTYFLRTPQQTERAIAELTRGLDADPTHLATLHNLSLMYIQTGKLAEAESTIGRLERVNPSYAQLPRLRSALDDARQKKTASS